MEERLLERQRKMASAGLSNSMAQLMAVSAQGLAAKKAAKAFKRDAISKDLTLRAQLVSDGFAVPGSGMSRSYVPASLFAPPERERERDIERDRDRERERQPLTPIWNADGARAI